MVLLWRDGIHVCWEHSEVTSDVFSAWQVVYKILVPAKHELISDVHAHLKVQALSS